MAKSLEEKEFNDMTFAELSKIAKELSSDDKIEEFIDFLSEEIDGVLSGANYCKLINLFFINTNVSLEQILNFFEKCCDYNLEILFNQANNFVRKSFFGVINNFSKEIFLKIISFANDKNVCFINFIANSNFTLTKSEIIEYEVIKECDFSVFDIGGVNAKTIKLFEKVNGLEDVLKIIDLESFKNEYGEVKVNKENNIDGIDAKKPKLTEEKQKTNPTTTQKTNSVEEEKIVKNNHTEWLKQRAIEGSYQGAAKVAVNTFIEGLCIAAEKANPFYGSLIKEFAKTDHGFVLLSGLMGAGIHFAPVDFVQSEKMQKIADKCVENAVGDGLNSVANFFGAFIAPAFQAAEKSMLRVEQKIEKKNDLEEEEEILQEQLQKKAM